MRRLLSQCPRRLQVLLVVAAALRIATVLWRLDDLTIDRDSYDAIARNLVDGHGFSSVRGQPTAFRPPLYPILLAGCRLVDAINPIDVFTLVAVLHVLLGTCTVGMTWLLTRRLGFEPVSCVVAATLVAIDPLLLLYTSQLMTETLFTFLVTALLLSLQDVRTGRRAAIAGACFGLAALCRPTIWAFGILAIVVAGIRLMCCRIKRQRVVSRAGCRTVAVFLSALALVICPWVIRNLVVLGHPLVMTTHGGYTLLLGNNPVFYAEVVSSPGQPVWQYDSLAAWQASIEPKLTAESAHLSEFERSDRLQDMAIDWIQAHPREFLACVWFRIRRLWSPGPENSDAIPGTVAVTVRRYYLATYVLLVTGLARHRVRSRKLWLPCVFVVSLTLLHAVYWANARMRAPAVPVISIIAAAAFSTVALRRRCFTQRVIPSCPGDEPAVKRSSS